MTSNIKKDTISKQKRKEDEDAYKKAAEDKKILKAKIKTLGKEKLDKDNQIKELEAVYAGLSKQEIEIVQLKEINDKEFKLNNFRIFLTYTYVHIPKDEYITWFTNNFGETKFIRLAHETGTNLIEHPHTHVLIHTKKPIRSQSTKILDYPITFKNKNGEEKKSCHPNIKICFDNKSFNNCKSYICKEDVDNNDLLEKEPNLWTKLNKCKTLQEAWETVDSKNPNDIFGIERLFALTRDKPDWKIQYSEEEKYPWEKEFEKQITYKSDRQINWIVDRKGGRGKTKWGLHMIMNHPSDWRMVNITGDQNHFANLFINERRNGWTGTGIIFNFSRSFEEKTTLYNILEVIKDGLLATTMYQGGIEVYNPFIHVWIFSNFYPDQEKLSEDRWKIWKINKNKELVYIHNKQAKRKYYELLNKKKQLPIHLDPIEHLKKALKDAGFNLTLNQLIELDDAQYTPEQKEEMKMMASLAIPMK